MKRPELLAVILTTCYLLQVAYAPPVVANKGGDASAGEEDAEEQMAYNVEYEHYLQEVVQLLESDPDFKAKIEKANPEDVKSGKIAEELDFLHHGIRTKLNEIKRRELDRLRDALREKSERENGIHELVEPGHIDHKAETFEKEDLRKLVVQATKDLEELDKQREKDFREYEMKKELEWRQKLANMTEEERQKAMQAHNETQKKHGDHPDVIHPGSKAQLEDVWQSVDKLPKDAFDPNTFFQLHDLTGDGVLDAGELEALFQKELDKVYDKNNPDDDMRERDEEMARMREHVMREWDQNKDGLISRDEFLSDVKKKEFDQNPGWDTLEKKKIYSEDDLKAFAEQWARASGVPVQGLYPPYGAYPYPYQPYPVPMQQQPYYAPPQQYQQMPSQQYQYMPQGGVPQYQQYPPHPAYAQQQWAQQQGQQQFQPHPAAPQQQVPYQQQAPYQGQVVQNQQPPQQHQQQPPQQPPQQQQQPPPQQQQPPPPQQQQQQPPQQQQQQQQPPHPGPAIQQHQQQLSDHKPPPPVAPVQGQQVPSDQQHQPIGNVAAPPANAQAANVPQDGQRQQVQQPAS